MYYRETFKIEKKTNVLIMMDILQHLLLVLFGRPLRDINPDFLKAVRPVRKNMHARGLHGHVFLSVEQGLIISCSSGYCRASYFLKKARCFVRAIVLIGVNITATRSVILVGLVIVHSVAATDEMRRSARMKITRQESKTLFFFQMPCFSLFIP